MHGRSLELFFVNGRPDSLVTAEMFGWTGHILVAPRLEIGEALKRREASYTGVYLLIGETDEKPKIYIGEGENISQRIRSHDTTKDWWTKAILITSNANNLNKAHVKYLEARLVHLSQAVKHHEVDNGNAPLQPSLSEAAEANMEAFLDNIKIIMSALGIQAFSKKTRPAKVDEKNDDNAYKPKQQIFTIDAPRLKLKGRAIVINGEFIVQQGSMARDVWMGVDGHGYHSLFNQLKENGVLHHENDRCVFTTNYAFQSPSAASAVIFGTARNGQTDWKHSVTGQTYKEWEKSEMDRLI